jgi:hypothetical protein
MARELKFRAYLEGHGWFEPSDIAIYGDGTVLAQAYAEDGNKVACYDETTKGLHFVQFTGLKDKTGAEIWEYDILEHEGYGVGVVKHSLDHDAEYYSRNTPPGYEGFLSCWGLQTRNPFTIYFTSFCNWCRPYEYMRKLGNVFDNPELLSVREP